MSWQIDVVRRWTQARNARDLEALLELSAADLKMHLARGTLHGEAGLRDWVERMGFGAAPYVELDGFYQRGDTVVAAVRTQLRFVDDGEPAGDWAPGGAAFELADGRVQTFRPDTDFDGLLRESHLGPDDFLAQT